MLTKACRWVADITESLEKRRRVTTQQEKQFKIKYETSRFPASPGPCLPNQAFGTHNVIRIAISVLLSQSHLIFPLSSHPRIYVHWCRIVQFFVVSLNHIPLRDLSSAPKPLAKHLIHKYSSFGKRNSCPLAKWSEFLLNMKHFAKCQANKGHCYWSPLLLFTLPRPTGTLCLFRAPWILQGFPMPVHLPHQPGGGEEGGEGRGGRKRRVFFSYVILAERAL